LKISKGLTVLTPIKHHFVQTAVGIWIRAAEKRDEAEFKHFEINMLLNAKHNVKECNREDGPENQKALLIAK
jgi:hypothetical protein